MQENWTSMKSALNRRSFVKKSLAAGAVTIGSGMIGGTTSLFADDEGSQNKRLSKGDAALLRFAAAAEILETDFWV